jgi:hypothetical protein
MVADSTLEFDAVLFDENRWYEIDTVEDLHQAELIFPHSPQNTDSERWLQSIARNLQIVPNNEPSIAV